MGTQTSKKSIPCHRKDSTGVEMLGARKPNTGSQYQPGKTKGKGVFYTLSLWDASSFRECHFVDLLPTSAKRLFVMRRPAVPGTKTPEMDSRPSPTFTLKHRKPRPPHPQSELVSPPPTECEAGQETRSLRYSGRKMDVVRVLTIVAYQCPCRMVLHCHDSVLKTP